MKTNYITQITAVSLTGLLLLSGCAKKDDKAGAKGAGKTAPQNAANAVVPVDVVLAKETTVIREIPVTGSLTALQTVSLTPKVNQRVVSVAGREGQSVRAGEVIVQQDTTDLARQLQQAEANLQAAQANAAALQASANAAAVRVQQARTNIGLQQSSSTAGVKDAEEQVRSAVANLELAKRPQRSQEVTVAENKVKQAQANYDKAKSDRERYDTLVKEGAAAQITLDQYVTQEKVAKADLDSAQQQLEIAREGGRDAQVRASETQVARAQSQLRLAKANQQQVQVKQDDLRAAEATAAQARAAAQQALAAVAQNQAAVALSRQVVSDASIRSPIDGVISERKIEPGQIAAPGTSVATIVAPGTVYFEAQVSETDVAYVRQGQKVDVTLDAYPNQKFTGTIGRVYPTGNAASRFVIARVEIDNGKGVLRPGLFARGEVVAETKKAVTVPVEAVVTDPIGALDSDEAKAALANTRLYVVENGVAKEVKVQQGLLTRDGKSVEVGGVQAGAQVVTGGQSALKDGAKVSVRDKNAPAQPAQQARRSTHAKVTI